MSTGDPTSALARMIRNGRVSTVDKLQRPSQLTVHMGTLVRVDNFNGVADLQWPDPSAPVSQSVHVIQHYTPSYQPQVGHVVIAHQYGNDLFIIGQHQFLNGTVVM